MTLDNLRAAVEWLNSHGYRIISEDKRLQQLCEVGGASKATAESFRRLLKPASTSVLEFEYEQFQQVKVKTNVNNSETMQAYAILDDLHD